MSWMAGLVASWGMPSFLARIPFVLVGGHAVVTDRHWHQRKGGPSGCEQRRLCHRAVPLPQEAHAGAWALGLPPHVQGAASWTEQASLKDSRAPSKDQRSRSFNLDESRVRILPALALLVERRVFCALGGGIAGEGRGCLSGSAPSWSVEMHDLALLLYRRNLGDVVGEPSNPVALSLLLGCTSLASLCWPTPLFLCVDGISIASQLRVFLGCEGPRGLDFESSWAS